MGYWIGLSIAIVFDAAVIAGADFHATRPQAVACAEQESPDAAIGRLVREIQRDPYRRHLWVALDRAVKASGRARITDAELIRAARESLAAGCTNPPLGEGEHSF